MQTSLCGLRVCLLYGAGSLEEDCRSMGLEVPEIESSESDEEAVEEGTPPEPEPEPEPEQEQEQEPEPESSEVLQVRISSILKLH